MRCSAVPRHARLLAALLAALVPVASPVRAQELVGRVVEEGSDGPVGGAFVVVLDDGDDRVAAVLTDEDGWFRVDVREPGTYRLRVDRIGYRSTTTEPVAVGPAGAGPVTIEVPGEAIRLAPIDVEGARRCVLRPEEGQATYALWEEARKALEITEWAGAEHRFVFDVVKFTRFLREPRMVVDSETVEVFRIDAPNPFVADSPEVLLRDGFIRGEGTDRTFDAPDAPLLLSDAFLDTHCFRRVAGEERGRIGLAFEPVDRDRPAEVEGTLWLDGETGELRFLEYRYVNADEVLPRRVDPDRYGGTVRFHRMEDGSWIAADWKIRSPVFWRDGRRIWQEGFSETEGSVVAVHTRDGRATPYVRVAGVITGRVVRGWWRKEGVPGARVRLHGTPYAVVSDAEGFFTFEGLPEGRYILVAEGEGLARRVIERVEVVKGDTVSVILP